MTSLEDHLKKGTIKLYGDKGEIFPLPEDFGQYSKQLFRHIQDHSSNHLTVKGESLKDYLQDVQNMYDLAFFLDYLSNTTKSVIHVDLDIHSFPNDYATSQGAKWRTEGEDRSRWSPSMGEFEKMWNLALTMAIGSNVYDYPVPQTEEEFEKEVALHAHSFLIGTKEQLLRYTQLKYYDPKIKNTLNVFLKP